MVFGADKTMRFLHDPSRNIDRVPVVLRVRWYTLPLGTPRRGPTTYRGPFDLETQVEPPSIVYLKILHDGTLLSAPFYFQSYSLYHNQFKFLPSYFWNPFLTFLPPEVSTQVVLHVV